MLAINILSALKGHAGFFSSLLDIVASVPRAG